MIRTVFLHGALGERFGREFRFDVVSPAQAVHALIVQLPGFRKKFRSGSYRLTRVTRRRSVDLTEKMLMLPLGAAEELHIVPHIAGAGSPDTRTVIGAALIVAAITLSAVIGPEGMAAAAPGLPFLTTSTAIADVAAIGVALAISGIAALLTKQPLGNESFLFAGQDNVTDQGGPVPLVYGGPTMVGSVLISAGLFTEALTPGTQPFDPSLAPNFVSYAQSG